jgi:hypothetical protein
MIAKYLESAQKFERLAADEDNPKLKADFQKLAASYRKLALSGRTNSACPRPHLEFRIETLPPESAGLVPIEPRGNGAGLARTGRTNSGRRVPEPFREGSELERPILGIVHS